MIYVNFVCTGNTCRSPMAEMMLKHELKQREVKGIRVKSSGTSTYGGDKINPFSRRALKALGVPCTKFLSKPYEYKDKELVVCMTSGHKQLMPYFALAKTLGEYTGSYWEVADPYGYSEEIYLECAKRLQSEIAALADYLVTLIEQNQKLS